MAGIQDFIATLAQQAPQPNIPSVVNVPSPQVQQPGFLDALTDPTGKSLFLLDLASRITQAPQVGQSPFNAVLQGANQATQGLAGRKASASDSALKARLAESTLATETAGRAGTEAKTAGAVRKLQSADLQDKLTESQIRKNDRLSAGKGGAGSAKIAERLAKAETLMSVDKGIKSIDEALFVVDRQDFFDQVEKDRSAALAKNQEMKFLLDPAAFADSEIAINKSFDERKAQYISNPNASVGAGTDVPLAPISGAPTTRQQILDAGPKALRAMLQERFGARATPEWLDAQETLVFGKKKAQKAVQTKPKAKAKPVVRKNARQRRAELAQKKRAEIKSKSDQTKDSEAIAKSELKTEVPQKSRAEMQLWLEKNKEFLSGPEKRRVFAMIRRAK